MDLGLRGKRALVTAASRGIGLAVARTLAEEGARVALCARHRPALEAAARSVGPETLCFPADLTRLDDIRELVREAVAGLGGLDILVSSTGGPPASSIEKASDDDFKDAVDLTLMSAVRLVRETLEPLEESGSGRILLIASVSIKQPVAGLILSTAPRSGLLGLNKALAQELAPRGIRTNLLLPGFTWTQRVEDLAASMAASQGVGVEEIRERWERDIPMGRLARPDEIASVAAFLVSGRSSYVTGTALQVDGGYVRTVL
ncbi:MAG: SDR family oxidoreductase [Planctomycetota bacterium]|jgi:3-oxoacyl-[acyl-carrier protein] reductase